MATKKTEPQALSTREVAESLGTTGRELRVFLRQSNDYEAVGAGSRYAFQPTDLPVMKTRFNAWTKARATKASEAKA